MSAKGKLAICGFSKTLHTEWCEADLFSLNIASAFIHTSNMPRRGIQLKISYRVSQKFVPIISCTISCILLITLFLLEISRRYLFHYREHAFRISVTGIPFLFVCLFVFFLITFCSRCGVKWDTACSPQMIHFELFYQLVRRSQFSPQTVFVQFRQLYIYIYIYIYKIYFCKKAAFLRKKAAFLCKKAAFLQIKRL